MNIHLRKGRSLYCILVVICSAVMIVSGCSKKDASSPAKNAGKENMAETSINDKKAAAADPAKVLVEVNGKKFIQADADKEINSRLAGIMGQVPEDNIEQIKAGMQKEVIDDFVTRTLLTAAADEKNIAVTDADVDKALEDIKGNLPEGVTLDEALKANGISEEKLRADISLGLRMNKLVESQLPEKQAPSDQEIQEYYDTNRQQFVDPETVTARHVLIKTDEKDDQKTRDEKKAKIEGLQKQLIAGADFAKIAKENSDCPSKERGGSLGTFGRGQMVKPFEDAAFSQEVNEIGSVVETQFGYHIIQVQEHNQERTKPLDEVKQSIANTIQRRRYQEAAEKYINELKANAKIVYSDEAAPAAH